MAAPAGRRLPRADGNRRADQRGAPAADAERLARVLAALADPIRLRIVGLVAGHALSGVEVAEALGISQALACHHLKLLTESGLLQRRRRGQVKYAILDRELLASYLRQVRDLAGIASGRA